MIGNVSSAPLVCGREELLCDVALSSVGPATTVYVKVALRVVVDVAACFVGSLCAGSLVVIIVGSVAARLIVRTRLCFNPLFGQRPALW